MTAFVDRPDAERMSAITDLDAIGPCAFYYTGSGITITVPRGATAAVLAWMRTHRLTDRDWHYFPLGSDQVPEIMRHDGNYPGSRGFHLYLHCVPDDEKPLDSV